MKDKNYTQNNLRLQQTVRFSEALLRASADGIVITDPSKKIIFANDTFCKILSSNREDVIETDLFLWLEKLNPNARDIWKGLESQISEHGIVKDVWFAMKTGEGMRYFSVNSSLLEKVDIEETGLIISIWHDITEGKMAKEALQQAHDELMRIQERTAELEESERKYRTLFEYSNDIVTQVDRYGKVLAVNNKLEEVFGFKPEEVIGKYFFNLGVLRLRDLPRIIAMFKNTVRKGMTRDKSGKFLDKVEIELRDKKGNFVFVETSTTILKKDGKIEGFLTNLRDITESKKAQERLKASEEKYSSLVEKGNDGIIILQDNVIKYVNSIICTMTGFTRKEAMGKPFLNYVSPEYKKIVQERYEKRLRGDPIPNIYEIEILSKNGLKIPVEINASGIEYEGRPASMAIIRDISQRKQAETILRIQKDIASSLSLPGDIDSMLEKILKAISKIERIDSGGIYISDSVAGNLILKVHYGFSSEFVQEVAVYSHETPQWRLVQAGQPAYLKYSEDIKKIPYLLKEGLRSVAVIPIVHEGLVIGSLNMGSHSLDDIPAHARNILETIAGQLRLVISRIQSEEELKETKNYLDKVIRSSYDSIFVVNEEGRFEFGNEAFFQLMGYPESEMLGHSFMKVIHPDYHDFIIKRWDEVQRGEGKPYEVDIVRKDGEVRSLSVSHTDMELGGIRKYCVIAKDITKTKQAEKELRGSQALLFNAFNNSPLLMTISDISTGRYVQVNDSFCMVSGFKRDEVIGKTSIQLGWIDEKERTRMVLELQKHGKVTGLELTLRSKSGKTVICRYSGDIIQTVGGDKLFLTAEDITQSKQVEDELAISRDRLIKAQEIGHMGSWEWDLVTNELVWSREVYTIYGVEPGIYKPNYEIVVDTLAPECKDDFLKNIDDALKLRKPFEGEYRIILLDGTIKFTHTKGEVIYGKEGNPIKMYGIVQDITDRKQAEIEREQFFKFFQISNDLMVIADPNGCFKKVNPACIYLLGYSETELLAKPFVDFVHPDDRQSTMDEMARQIKLGFSFNFENRYQCKDGTIRWLSWRANYDKEEGFTYATARDVTERRLVEEEIRDMKDRLSMAQEAGKIGAFDWHIQENKTIWTDQMEAIYGFPAGSFGGQNENWEKMIHPEDHDRVMAHAAIAMSEKKDIEIEYRIVWNDGTVHWILDKARTIYSESGKPLRMVGVNMDITRRKEAEEKLRKSEELFRKLVEAEPECVKLMTKENIVVDMNPAGLRMIEADSREQVIGKSFLGIIDPEYRKKFVDIVQRVFDSESVLLEFSINGLKGTKRWLETHAVPLRDKNGEIDFLLAVTRDITERKHAQEEMYALVAREQAALAEAQAAKKLDRMKSMFIAATSHELRTPLNSIIGFTSLVLDGTSGELNPDQKEQLSVVHSSGKHLLLLINDIIDLSMIESGRREVVVGEFNLRRVVDEAATNLSVIINEKKLRLKIDVGDIIMKSDRMRILQCLINLINNAVKYTEKGSIEITAKVIDKNVELSVIDTGIGIKTEDIPKLFGPFVRLQSPLTIKTSGTGLGLYLVKKLALDFLGGDVEVESEFGAGSKFTLRVPVELKGKHENSCS